MSIFNRFPSFKLRMRRKGFVFLEVMIALTLASICAVPLITKPVRLFQTEIRLLEEMERQRLADWTFSEIKAHLLTAKFDELPQQLSVAGPFSLPPASVQLPGMASKELKRSYTLQCHGDKEGKDGKWYRLYYVKIALSPGLWEKEKRREKQYEYRVVVATMTQ